MKKSAFGEFIRSRRVELGHTLRELCRQVGLDPGNVSKMERGLLAPPQDEGKLEELARVLEIEPGTAEWSEYIALAEAESGRIPKDLMSDEEFVSCLPLLFRSVRGEPIPDDKLDELVGLMKRRLEEN